MNFEKKIKKNLKEQPIRILLLAVLQDRFCLLSNDDSKIWPDKKHILVYFDHQLSQMKQKKKAM